MKTLLSFLVLLPLVVGCIFGNNSDGNKEPQVGAGPVTGFISVLDERTLTEKGASIRNDILAAFGRPTAIKKAVGSFSIDWKAFSVEPDRSFRGLTERASTQGTCTFKSEPLKAAQLHLVSVGRLLLGSGDQPLEIPYNPKKGKYGGLLAEGQIWPKGKYLIRGEGSVEALAFEIEMKMPAVLEDARVNGELIENGTISLKYNAPIEVTWKRQESVSDDDIIVFGMMGEKGGNGISLNCSSLEKDIAATWNIPTEELSKFSVGLANASIYVMRRNEREFTAETTKNVETIGAYGDRVSATILKITN